MVSQREQILIQEFRKSLQAIYEPDVELEDYALLAFLRARNMEVAQGLAQFKRFLEVQEDLTGLSKVQDYVSYESLEEISTNLCYQLIGNDCDGNLVIWLPGGRWDFRAHLEHKLKKEVFLHCLKIIFEIFKKLYEEGEKAGQHRKLVLLLDSEKLSFKKVTHLESVHIMFSFLKDIQVFSKLFTKIYVVNAHRVTRFLLTIVRPFLSTKMANKLVLLCSDDEEWKQVLLNRIPIEVLPTEYGGNGARVLMDMDN